MKKVFASFVSAVLIVFGMSSLSVVAAATCPFGGSPNWQGVCDTTTDSGQEYHGSTMTEEEAKTHTENISSVDNLDTSSTNSTSIISTPTTSSPTTSTSTNSSTTSSTQNSVPETVTSNPDLGHGYAVIDSSGNILNIIVCSYDVCGKNDNWLNLAINQGVFPLGARLVLQTLRNEQTGNVAAYMHAKYNKDTNSFFIVEEDGAIFKVPLSDPELEKPICIENCKVIENNNFQGNENSEDFITEENNMVSEENIIPMMFSTNLKPNTFATIIATNKNKTKIWKTKVNKNGIAKIKINKKYKKWKFKVKVGS